MGALVDSVRRENMARRRRVVKPPHGDIWSSTRAPRDRTVTKHPWGNSSRPPRPVLPSQRNRWA